MGLKHVELAPLTAHPQGPFLFSSFSSSLSPRLSQRLSLPSAPPHSLFMSAWIAPFLYNQLPAHYQSHKCFNNRSPPPLSELSFPWQPMMKSRVGAWLDWPLILFVSFSETDHLWEHQQRHWSVVVRSSFEQQTWKGSFPFSFPPKERSSTNL